MASKMHSLEAENKKLKMQISILQKQVNSLKNKKRKSPIDCEISGLKNKSKLDESSIEKNNSKESWSKLINTDLEILKEFRSPSSRGFGRKSSNEFMGDMESKVVLHELNSLKKENKQLKRELQKKKTGKTPRCESKASRKTEDLNETKNNRTKHCPVCVKLLSKGYTTRFCPTHGRSFKAVIKPFLS